MDQREAQAGLAAAFCVDCRHSGDRVDTRFPDHAVQGANGLCHTGLVWESTVNGRVLHFRLAGINNQNFIMRDDETGTWWQQVTGKAIHGPLQGHQLKGVFHDDISFGIWKREKPHGRVLKPDEKIVAAKEYEAADWEVRVGKMRVVEGTDIDKRLSPRALVIGVEVSGKSVAYPLSALQKQSPIMDMVGVVPIMVVLGDDKRSVRAFERTVDGRRLEFFQTRDKAGESQPPQAGLLLIDAETGSTWDFEGKAIAGPLAGRQLKKVFVLEDYWFDWRIYHPDTGVYDIGPG